MGAAKNMFRGIISAAIAVVMYVAIPWIGLNVVKTLDLGAYGSIDYARFNINNILFFIQSLGIIQAGIAFAKGSSPKYSKRRAVFSLLSFGGAGAYSYIIKYSGLSQVPIILTGIGEITVTFDALVFMVFGIVVLNSVLALFDLFITIKDQKNKVVYSLDKEKKEREMELERSGEISRGVANP
nr:hypothetical protein [Candidatus Sigynarchaeota archaeon]